MRNFLTMAVFAVALTATPAIAQQGAKPIELREGRDFRHKHTRITLPATLGGVPRRAGSELVPDHLDISVQCRTPDDGEMVSVYIYRVPSGDMPLWFDRSTQVVALNQTLGRTTPAGTPTTFALPGQSLASALVRGFEVDGSKRYRGSAIAMAAHGDWLVKLRYSSTSVDAAGAVERAKAMVAQLGWPRTIDRLAAVQPVAACTSTLAIKPDAAPASETEEQRMQRAIMGGLLGSLAADQKLQAKAVRSAWCSREAENPTQTIYSPNNATDSYLIPLSDSGIALVVGTGVNSLHALMDKPNESRSPQWQATVWTQDRTIDFETFDGLPPVARALATLKTEPIGSASTFGDKPSISITPSATQ